MKTLLQKVSDYEGIGEMGDIPKLTPVQTAPSIKLIGQLYGQEDCTSLNNLRAENVIKSKHVKPRRLPPTDDSFLLHLQRCLY